MTVERNPTLEALEPTLGRRFVGRITINARRFGARDLERLRHWVDTSVLTRALGAAPDVQILMK